MTYNFELFLTPEEKVLFSINGDEDAKDFKECLHRTIDAAIKVSLTNYFTGFMEGGEVN